MLSLADQLIKFQKFVFENKIDELITVQDGFDNGSLTIRDLVKENHTIITEFKKMKNVFINYTKLNKKINDRINEYELNVGTQLINLVRMTNFIEKTIDSSIQKMKSLYDDMWTQNRHAFQHIQKAIIPLRNQIKQKISITNFNESIAKLRAELQIEENYHDLDNSNAKQQNLDYPQIHISQQKIKLSMIGKKKQQSQKQSYLQSSKIVKAQKQQRLLNVFTEKESPTIKRKKSMMNIEEIQTVKDQMMEYINSKNIKLQQTIKELKQQSKENDYAVKRFSEEIQQKIMKKIEEHSFQQKKQFKKLHENVEKLHKDLQNKTNDQSRLKIREFTVNYLKDKFFNDIIYNIQQLKNNQIHYEKSSINKFYNLQAKLNQTEQSILTQTNSRINKSEEEIFKQIRNDRFQIKNLKQEFNNSTNSTRSYLKSLQQLINSNQNNLNSEIHKIKDNILYISHTLETNIHKMVVNKFQQNFNQLQQQFSALRKLESVTDKKVIQIFELIKDIKQVVARKVNYSEFITLFQKKANKDDIGQIKDMIILKTEQSPLRKDSKFLHEHQYQEFSPTQKMLKKSLDVAHFSNRLGPKSFILGFPTKNQKNIKQKMYRSKKSKNRPVTADNFPF